VRVLALPIAMVAVAFGLAASEGSAAPPSQTGNILPPAEGLANLCAALTA
jgi:hypothetical protein